MSPRGRAASNRARAGARGPTPRATAATKERGECSACGGSGCGAGEEEGRGVVSAGFTKIVTVKTVSEWLLSTQSKTGYPNCSYCSFLRTELN
jgi:hypothetical protein